MVPCGREDDVKVLQRQPTFSGHKWRSKWQVGLVIRISHWLLDFDRYIYVGDIPCLLKLLTGLMRRTTQGNEVLSFLSWRFHRPITYLVSYHIGVSHSRDSLLVRAPDSWSKGCEFESLQERLENFLLQSQLCVLTLIACPFHSLVYAVACKRARSFCQKCRWQVTPKHAYTLDPTKSEWADYAAVQL